LYSKGASIDNEFALKLATRLEESATISDMGRHPDPKDTLRQAAKELRRLVKELESKQPKE